MNTPLDCVPCLLRQSIEAMRYATDDRARHEEALRLVLSELSKADLEQPWSLVVRSIHRKVKEQTGASDPYREAKSLFNRLAMAALPELENMVRLASDPLLAAVQLSVAANAIDLGASPSLSEGDVRAALVAMGGGGVCGNWEEFRKAVSHATSILYLADNAGEIAVDTLVVKALGPKRVTVAVRGAPILNDATLDDARLVGMVDLVRVIENGSDIPGTLLSDCSLAFQDEFHSADLVIAKGQGNYETLMECQKSVAFLFKVKCPFIASRVGLPLGTHTLVYHDGPQLPSATRTTT